jgi:hypothetical protein
MCWATQDYCRTTLRFRLPVIPRPERGTVSTPIVPSRPAHQGVGEVRRILYTKCNTVEMLEPTQAVPRRGHPLGQARAHLLDDHRCQVNQHLAEGPRSMINGTCPNTLSTGPALTAVRLDEISLAGL